MYLLLCVITLSTLAVSCNSVYDVKLPNGAVVKAKDSYDRNISSGDTVCVSKSSSYGDIWEIDNEGIMKDTVNFYSRYYGDSVYYSGFTEYKIGVVW